MCLKGGNEWVMASYFPYGPQSFTDIKNKLTDDVGAARHRAPFGVAFATNQKLSNSQKSKLKAAGVGFEIDVFHLERTVHILDRPEMAQIRGSTSTYRRSDCRRWIFVWRSRDQLGISNVRTH